MAKKRTAAAPLRLQDKKIAISGSLDFGSKTEVQKLIEGQGGTLAAGVSATIDYLVLGSSSSRGISAAEKKARELIKTKGAAIQIMDEPAFHQLLAPTLEESLELLRGGPRGIKKWNERYGKTALQFEVKVTDQDFRKIKLTGARLLQLTFERCDFREADLSKVQLCVVIDCQFDDAKLTNVSFERADNCRFVNARLVGSTFEAAPRSVFDGAEFKDGDISDFKDGSARGANFHKAALCVGDFSRVDLTGANLTKAVASYIHAPQASFENADLTDANLEETELMGANFRGANLTKADLTECDLTQADLSGANLQEAEIGLARFSGANLKGTNFRGAYGTNADFTGADLMGADFTDANVIGCKFDPTATKKAKGLALPALASGSAGPKFRELEKVVRAATSTQMQLQLQLPDGSSVLIRFQCYGSRQPYSFESVTSPKGGVRRGAGPKAKTFSDSLQAIANRWSQGIVQPDTVEISATKSKIKKAELQHLVVAAWCELVGHPIPTLEELKQGQKQAAASVEGERAAAVDLLRTGKKGVKEWNARSGKEHERIGQFRKADFSKVDLSGVSLFEFDLEGADFSQSKLVSAKLEGINGKQANFNGSSAKKASFLGAKLADATMIQADLTQASMLYGNLLRVDFTGANLNKTEFQFTNVFGANFTDCDLSTAQFEETDFDEKTSFPAGYTPVKGLRWKGAGKDPRLIDQIAAAVREAGPLDFEAFMKNLEDRTDAAKLANAMKMLKADKFNLFANTEESSVTGVVKSQSDPDLVYACRLDSAGEYACCTQNLNVCGGLRGSLCKHLLVLLIGLTSGGALDPTKVHAWMAASRLQKPKLDKDLMSEIFLKYKGAEAGEIDWRPTETVPEDFYAF